MRKISIVVIGIFLGVLFSFGYVFGDNPLRNGDYNGDGVLTNGDWQELRRFIQGSLLIPPVTINTITEVDGEGRGCNWAGRFVRSEPVSRQFIVLDCCTKLIYASLPKADLVPLTRTEADVKISDLNMTLYGGFSDWRMPTSSELYSLVHFGDAIEPAIASEFVEITSLLAPGPLDIWEEAVWTYTNAVDLIATAEDESARTQKFLPRAGFVGHFLTDPAGMDPSNDEAILLPVRAGTL